MVETSLSTGSHLRKMELVILVENVFDGVYFQEFCTSTNTDITTKIGNLVGEVNIPFLA